MLIKKLSLFLLCYLNFTAASFPQVVINEVMSSNTNTIWDEDNSSPDWIELYNTSSSTADISGYYLSDDSGNLQRWQIPAYTMGPGEHLLVFASGKDKYHNGPYWNTVINWGDEWKYKRRLAAPPPAAWKEFDFDDSSWDTGKTSIGYGDDDDSTVISICNTLLLRKYFSIEDINSVNSILLHIDYDDAFIAYINGIEVARGNLGKAGKEIAYSAFAEKSYEAQIYQGGLPELYSLDISGSVLRDGENVIAIEVRPEKLGDDDMTIIPFLTLGLNEPPDPSGGLNELLQSILPRMHTNFKLSDYETLYLSNVQGEIIDSVVIPDIQPDASFGRYPDGNSSWHYFLQPTPGNVNAQAGFPGIADVPVIQPAGNFFNNSVTVQLTNTDQSKIYYTLNGDSPDGNSFLYNAPFTLDSTAVVKCRTIRENFLPSPLTVRTFFIDEEKGFPIVSLSTDSVNLWDIDSGIYVFGNSYNSEIPYWGANFHQDWEKEAHIEFFDEEGNVGFSHPCGIKIYGDWMRMLPQKSLSVFFRAKYGVKELTYNLFPESGIDSYKSFVLRNCGNDWLSTMLRDPFMLSLIRELDFELQNYRPAILFLNGKYWGIHNIRDKINEDFIESRTGIPADNIDLLEDNSDIIEGTNDDYEDILGILWNNNFSEDEFYDYFKTRIDVNNFFDYQICQIYFNNVDWPDNNVKFWREKTESPLWRWIVYDTDFGFGLRYDYSYDYNYVTHAIAGIGRDWNAPTWSFFLIKKLLENEKYKIDFINRFGDLSNSLFKKERVKEKLDVIKNMIVSQITRHIERWKNTVSYSTSEISWSSIDSYENWESNIEVIRTFADLRLDYLRDYYVEHFNLTGQASVQLYASYQSGGTITINKLEVNSFPWSGIYFQDVPVRIKAKPNYGYRFVEWIGDTSGTESEITVMLSETNSFTAVFEKVENEPLIVINEINYNSAADYDTEDWIELYNNTDAPVDLSSWYFTDGIDSNKFFFPEGYVLEPEKYLVLCRNTAAFKQYVPLAENVLGDFSFSLSNGGEEIKLIDNLNRVVDSVYYDDAYPWPVEPDGEGSTLSLRHPDMNNTDYQSWAASGAHGTPGLKNDVYTSVKEEPAVSDFRLMQNYPNPFNPATTIKYSIPVSSGQSSVGSRQNQSSNQAINQSGMGGLMSVKLIVYDVLGREVSTLVDTEQRPGNYEVKWDATGQASGVYFYKLTARTYTETKKMILLR